MHHAINIYSPQFVQSASIASSEKNSLEIIVIICISSSISLVVLHLLATSGSGGLRCLTRLLGLLTHAILNGVNRTRGADAILRLQLLRCSVCCHAVGIIHAAVGWILGDSCLRPGLFLDRHTGFFLDVGATCRGSIMGTRGNRNWYWRLRNVGLYRRLLLWGSWRRLWCWVPWEPSDTKLCKLLLPALLYWLALRSC